MSTPFSTLRAAVDVAQTGPNRLEARNRATGEVLGTALRSRGQDCEWIGWLVDAGGRRQVVATITTARYVLADFAASILDGGR